ncbi:DUF2796 domain-containing protein [Actimicrobium antarcticum]|uniref:DUF2796 domain-containing protein n=1 Tax=Actimicrobium antarcticum TaxID=1051899 RepID=A0ABP7TZ69_9BURK
MTQQSIIRLGLMALMASTQAFSAEPGAHVHGLAMLQVTQDQNTVSIDLDSPLGNLLGFERAPDTDKQKQAVQQMIEKLRQPEKLFALTAAAQCTAGPVQLTAPVLQLGVPEKGGAEKDGEHAGIEFAVSFHCRMPAALKDLNVNLFNAFSGLHQLDVQVVGPRGQSAAKLTPKQRRLFW